MHFERGSLPPRFPSDKQLVAEGAIVFAKAWASRASCQSDGGSFNKSGKKLAEDQEPGFRQDVIVVGRLA